HGAGAGARAEAHWRFDQRGRTRIYVHGIPRRFQAQMDAVDEDHQFADPLRCSKRNPWDVSPETVDHAGAVLPDCRILFAIHSTVAGVGNCRGDFEELREPNEMKNLKNTRCLVTGAASGIGRAMALELAREGVHLYLLDVDVAGLHMTIEAC